MPIISVILILLSQSGSAQSQDNYYTICKELNSYYNSNPKLKAEEDGGYMEFLRWKEFWRNRVYNGDSLNKGKFSPYIAALTNSLKNRIASGNNNLFSVWFPLGPDTITSSMCAGQVSALYVDTISDKTMNTIYIGTSSSGIWKTTDGGINWMNVTDGSTLLINGITSIVGDPNNSDILYASTSAGFLDNHSYTTGIIQTHNAGLSWTRLDSISPLSNKPLYGLLLDPNNTQRMFALYDTTVIRSLDGGLHWNTIFRFPKYIATYPNDTCNQQRHGRNIIMKYGNADYIYVATDCWGGHPRAQVWKIYNPIADTNQITATQLDLNLPNYGNPIFTQRFNIAVTRLDPEAIYIACMPFDSARLMIWKYSNGWVRENVDTLNLPQGIGYFKFEMLVSPTDTNVLYVGGLSMDRWVKMNNNLWSRAEHTPSGDWSATYHDDTRCAKLLKGSAPNLHGGSDIIFAGNDGGLSKSTDGIHSWRSLNGKGLTITQFWGIGGANSIPNIVLCGSQDNCFFKFTDGNWFHNENLYGDFGNIVADDSDPNFITMYGNRWGSGNTLIAKSNDLGVHWNAPSMDTVLSEPRLVNPQVKLNPQNHKTVFFGAHNLYKSYDKLTTTCIKVPVIACNTCFDPISAFDIAKTDTNTIYVAYDSPNWSVQTKKFLKSNDYGASWVDLTSNLTGADHLLDRYCVTDLVISPTDPRTLWISFGGVLSPWGDSARVLVSHDGGEHWTNFAKKGLPPLPINCIRYMNGYNDRLFVGTDAGVFYYDNSQTQWQPFNTGLPVCVVNDLEINDVDKIIRAGTYGRGLWETNLNCLYDPNNPIVIDKDTTWRTVNSLNCSVYIDSSYTLTITDTVKFPPLGKIYVKQGGFLFVNGGVLTSKCQDMWQGIEVWGRSSSPEATYFQGNVILKNGAVIENARIGITTGMKDVNGYLDWGTTGGIIKTDNAFFKNNYKAVEFFGNRYGQASLFRNTKFLTTGPFVDGHSTPSDFVTMSGTAGVAFEGCSFRNTTVPDTVVPRSINGRGIFCYNSSFMVSPYVYCRVNYLPCPNGQSDTIKSVFQGLYYGIRALGSFPIFPITINSTNFLSNFRGVYLSNMTNPSITSNYFSNMFLQSAILTGDTVYGLYLERSNLYTVQENKFRAPRTSLYDQGNPMGMHRVLYKQFGIVVDNSGTDPNEIYKNIFDTLEVAINAQNLNKSSSGDSTGLVLKCNQYRNNSYDELVSRKDTTITGGIAIKQGAGKNKLLDPAGNIFSHYHDTTYAKLRESDIRNRGEFLVYWSHKRQQHSTDPRVYPDYVDVNYVLRKQVYKAYNDSCCPSKIFSGGGISQDNLKQLIAQDQNTGDSLRSMLNSLVDGGNTNSMITDIVLSNSSQILILQQNLLNNSPYLSDTVMKQAINNETVLPNEVIRDVLVANPQAAKSTTVLRELNNRTTPMPDTMMSEILNGRDTVSAKEELEANLYSVKLDRQYYFNELLRYYQQDTVNPSASHDSLIALLTKEKLLSIQYILAFEYLYDGNISYANSTLGNIPQLFNLSDQQTRQHQNYRTFFDFLINQINHGKNTNQLTQQEIDQLNEMTHNATEPIKSYARDILEANGLLTFHEPIIVPNENLKSTEARKKLKTDAFQNDMYMKVFPNPAKQYVIVEYNLKEDLINNQNIFSIFNSNGILLETKILQRSFNQFIVKTGSFVPGVYVFIINSGKKHVCYQKVTIIQ